MRINEYDQNKIVKLINELNYHTNLYNQGKPVISDQEWDELYFQLVDLERATGIYLPNSPTQSIEYKIVNALNKVTHNHPMLSLDKTKDWNEFVRYFNYHDVVGMLKLDGLTCSLTYENGYLVRAETRGNGIEGEDILHNAKVVKSIPNRIQYNNTLTIDGEIICTYKDFEAFKDQYANPRNFASGSIRLLDSNECAKRNLTFVAWNLVTPIVDEVIGNFTELSRLGFIVTPWTSSWDWDAKEYLIARAEEYGYPIDGLVGRFNSVSYGESLGSTDHHSKAAYAFKFYDETQTTSLKDIEWTMGRTGQITPVAIFEPIELQGAICSRASMHNLTIMKDIFSNTFGPYKGQTLEIYRANMIIPQILSAGTAECKADTEGLKFEIPTVCPVCGGKLDIECQVVTEVLRCNNPECQGQLLNRLEHFCSKKGLDIKGLSKATLAKLIEWEWINELADLYKLSVYKTEWINKPGFGEKSVENILQAIENSRKPKLETFISAIGIPQIGKTLSVEIAKHFNSYEEFKKAAKNKWNFMQIDKIAEEKCSSIWNFDFREADNVDDYILEYTKEETAAAGSQTLEGQVICITGGLKHYKNRDELTKVIQSRGGKVTSSVSKNTSWLVNNDINSTSSKNKTAERLGVPIITEEEFINLYLS